MKSGTWKKGDLSPSSLKMWLDCPRKWFYNYKRKIRGGDRDFFLMGNVFDEVLFEEFRHDIGQDIDPIIDLAADELKYRMKTSETLLRGDGVANSPVLNPDTLEFEGRKFTDDEIRDTVSMFRVWSRGLLKAVQDGEDGYGNKVNLPGIEEMQVECTYPIEVDGQTIRLRGYADILHTDGSVTDIKMASAWAPVMWTHGRVLSELQWLVYSLALNTTTFKYLVVDKLKQGRWPKQEAKAPSVRVITNHVYPRDVQHLKDIVTQFVRSTDYMTMGADNKGVFPPKPDYRGVQNALGRKTDEMLLTQNNFCQQLCDYKPLCFKECFSGEQRVQ